MGGIVEIRDLGMVLGEKLEVAHWGGRSSLVEVRDDAGRAFLTLSPHTNI